VIAGFLCLKKRKGDKIHSFTIRDIVLLRQDRYIVTTHKLQPLVQLQQQLLQTLLFWPLMLSRYALFTIHCIFFSSLFVPSQSEPFITASSTVHFHCPNPLFTSVPIV
jgi:hypothetical protein